MSGESPKQSRRSANERRAAAQAMRQQQLAKERRRRNLIAGVGVVLVLIVIGALVAVGLKDKHGGATAASAAVAQEVTHVPAATFDAIGKGIYTTGSLPQGMASNTPITPTPISSTPLTDNGKPRILYVGAEWCPYCAAQRWVMAVALSRFGTFSNLGEVYSAADDGDLASLAFHGSTYKSDYITFDPKEIEDRDHNKLDTLTAADSKLFNGIGKGAFPFIDIAGKYQAGAMYDIEMISGMTQAQIAAALKDPSNPVAKAIDGSANVLTATICKLTNNQPGNVCNSAGVRAAA